MQKSSSQIKQVTQEKLALARFVERKQRNVFLCVVVVAITLIALCVYSAQAEVSATAAVNSQSIANHCY